MSEAFVRHPEIDRAILGHAKTVWQKVALVIVQVADACQPVLDAEEDGFQVVARHIERLVQEGALSAQGSLKDWRHSEIRRL